MRRRSAVAFASMLLAACATINWSTLQALNAMEVEDFDPATARLAIRPWARPFNVEFGVDYWAKDDITRDEFLIDEDFLMMDITSANEQAALPIDPASRETVRVYGFSAKDADRMADVNARIAALLETPKAARGGKTGEVSVGILMLPDDATYEAICPHNPRRKYSAWIRVSAREPYRPLAENRSLSGLARGVVEDMCKARAPA